MARYFTSQDIASQDDCYYYLSNSDIRVRKQATLARSKKFYPLEWQMRDDGGFFATDDVKIIDFTLFHLPAYVEEIKRKEDISDLQDDKLAGLFANLKVGALFMEMGTGKTKTILDIYTAKNINNRIVYITPASLIEPTRRECAKWYDYDITFISSESISQSDYKYATLANIIKGCFLIVDESIKFKNADSKRTKRLKRIAHEAEYRYILNGTPMTRSILDLLAQMDILSPKIIGMDEAEFAQTFLEYKLENKHKSWRIWSKPHNEEALMKLIAPFTIEMDLNFDKKVSYENIHFDLTDYEIESYNEFKLDFLKNNRACGFLEMAQSFQNFCTASSAKLEFLRNWKDKDTLFFVKYRKWFEILEPILWKKGWSVGVYNADDKDELEQYDCGILTYGCGAFGLNLQKFNKIVFVDNTFDYAQIVQAEARIKRMGQTRDLEIYHLTLNTKLEKIMRKSLDKKERSARNVKQILSSMTEEELLCL